MKGRDTLAEPGRRKHCRSERSERRSAQRGPGVERVEGFLAVIDLYNFFPKTNKLNIQFN